MRKKQYCKGFTLVEVVVTIAIMGIAMLPLSFIFTRSLEATGTTKTELVLTQQAQQYVENVKARSYKELNILDESADEGISFTIRYDITKNNPKVNAAAFPRPLEGYYAQISLNKLGNYDIEKQLENYDAIITVGNDYIETEVPQNGMATIKSSITNPRDSLIINMNFNKSNNESEGNKIELGEQNNKFNLHTVTYPDNGHLIKNKVKLIYNENMVVNIENNLVSPITIDAFQSDNKASVCTINTKKGVVIKGYNDIVTDSNEAILYTLNVQLFKEDEVTSPSVSITTTKME